VIEQRSQHPSELSHGVVNGLVEESIICKHFQKLNIMLLRSAISASVNIDQGPALSLGVHLTTHQLMLNRHQKKQLAVSCHADK